MIGRPGYGGGGDFFWGNWWQVFGGIWEQIFGGLAADFLGDWWQFFGGLVAVFFRGEADLRVGWGGDSFLRNYDDFRKAN